MSTTTLLLNNLKTEVQDLLDRAFPPSENQNKEEEIQQSIDRIRNLLNEKVNEQEQQTIENNKNNEEENNNNGDLVQLCQTMLDRLQNKTAAFDYIQRKLQHLSNSHVTAENNNNGGNDSSLSSSAPVDFDFLLNNNDLEDGNEQQQQKETSSSSTESDVVTILCDRIVQLEREKQALSNNNELLTIHLRNARGALNDTSKRIELQCWRSLEEVTKLQNKIDLIRDQTHYNNTGSNSMMMLSPSHHFQPGAIMNVATTNTENTNSNTNNKNNNTNLLFGSYTTPRRTVETMTATQQQTGVDNNELTSLHSSGNLSPASVGARRQSSPSSPPSSPKHDYNTNTNNNNNIDTQQDANMNQNYNFGRRGGGTSSEENEQQRRQDAEKAASALLSTISDPLDKIYLQSYPSLGIGMILQSLAVVFKREYDVTGLDDDDDDDDEQQQQQERKNAENCDQQDQQKIAGTPTTAAEEDQNKHTRTSKPKKDPQQQFDEACQQFQLTLKKDLLPLIDSLPILQNQMSMLIGNSSSMRADYVTKCLSMKIKPNSGVMKALTAVTVTDRRRIRAFDCSNFLIGDLGVAALANSVLESMYRLERLDLRTNNLHPNGIRALCSLLRRHPSITEIDLRGNPVGRAGAKMLLGVAMEVPRIEKIELDDKAIEDPLRERIKRELLRNNVNVAAVHHAS